MMHEPMLLIALAILVGVALMLMMNGARKRRIRMKIEPIPPERLDNTPVRSEILSEVRVRERADALRAENEEKALATEQAIEPEVVDIVESDSQVATPVAFPFPFTLAVTTPTPATETPPLSQADLFPEEILSPKVPAVEALDASAPAMDHVYSVHVMATTQLFEGRQLLELLLQYGLRFGDMDIFHRHEHPTGQGDVLFSMAQAVEPGTFDINSLSRDLVPGVSFFMSLPGKKSTLAFDLMMDTARRLAHELHAELLDANSQALTQEVMDQWRDDVVSYERQQYQSL